MVLSDYMNTKLIVVIAVAIIGGHISATYSVSLLWSYAKEYQEADYATITIEASDTPAVTDSALLVGMFAISEIDTQH